MSRGYIKLELFCKSGNFPFTETHFWIEFKGLGTILNGWCWVKSYKILF